MGQLLEKNALTKENCDDTYGRHLRALKPALTVKAIEIISASISCEYLANGDYTYAK